MQQYLDLKHRGRNDGMRKSDRTRTGALGVSEQADLQRPRTLRAQPWMEISPAACSIFDFRFEDFALSGYDVHPRIEAEVAV